MQYTNRRALEAIARVKFKNDPALRKLAEEEGVDLDEAAAEYAANLGVDSSKQKPGLAGNQEQKHIPETRGVPDSWPAAVVRLLAEAGPMTRTEIHDEAVRRKWQEPADDPVRTVGNAVMRLIKKGAVMELPGRKPRKVAIAPRGAQSSQ